MADLREFVRKIELFDNRGDYNSVIAVATEGIVNFPDMAHLYLARGIAYGQIGKVDQAISDVQMAVQLEPSHEVKKVYKKTLKELIMAQYQEEEEINSSLRKIDKAINNAPCFITTAVCDCLNKPDDCYELTQFRLFRDKWLIHQPDGERLIGEYYDIAPKIVSSIDKYSEKMAIYQQIWTNYLRHCLSAIEDNDFEFCKTEYMRMVNKLKGKYL
jgi:tetratricopeptide (TPR) repeat protein